MVKQYANGNPWPKKLKALRAHYDVTQEQVASRIHAPASTWRNWEYGRRKVSPTVARLLVLSFPEFFRRNPMSG